MTEPPVPLGISIHGLAFAYGTLPVLESVTLDIPKGELWALVGRSGIGKTTLLNIIAGLFTPSEGTVRVHGRDGKDTGRIKGIVFQDDSLLGWLSAEQNILFPNNRKPTLRMRQEAARLLQAVGLATRSTALPHELSAGMRKRLDFARALAADTEYLLADEPFGTVDALTRRDLWRLWLELQDKAPRTGLLSTHDPEEALRLCDAVATLRQGPPSRIGTVLRVPPEIRRLTLSEQSNDLVRLQATLLQSLGAPA